jgi:divalent metal cation (Fe/Co/Zn/Cd) transporter
MTFVQAHDVAYRVQEAVRARVPDVREVLVEPVPLTDDIAAESVTSDAAG